MHRPTRRLATAVTVLTATLLIAAACAPAAPGEPGPIEYIFNQITSVLFMCWFFIAGGCTF